MNKNHVIDIRRKYNNLKKLAIALLLLLLGVIGYEIQNKNLSEKNTVENKGNNGSAIKKSENTGNDKTKHTAHSSSPITESIDTDNIIKNEPVIRNSLAITYKFSVGKFSIVPILGAGVNFLINQRIETQLQGTTNEKQTISSLLGLKSKYFNSITGLSLDYNFNKNISISLNSSLNLALTSINKNASVKSYPNMLGIAAGVKIKF